MTSNQTLPSPIDIATDSPAIPRSRAWRRFRRNRAAIISLFVLAIIVLTCLITIGSSTAHYQSQQLDYNRHAPQLQADFAPFGYDVLGRNMFWRCLFGGLVSLGIGLAAATIAVVIGTTWGAVAGWCGGRIDNEG